MRTEPCKKCNAFDFYTYGKFSYCRPCHNEANRKYIQNKRMGNTPEILKPPSTSLGDLVGSRNKTKIRCAQGHIMSGDNVRRSSQRNGKNLRRLCRACERNAKRIKYGLAPEPAPTKLSDILDS